MVDVKIGDRIRFYRIQQNKTQEDLANGLISVSYLSKIENNLSLPSLEVVDMLCEKLGIRFIDEEEPNLLEELKDWYKLMVFQEKEEAESRYENLKEKAKRSSDSTSLVYFMLFEYRYQLMKWDIQEAESLHKKISEISDILTDELNYFNYKFIGLYEYLNGRYKNAYDNYKKAESILLRSVFDKWEEADLCYSLGLTSSQLWKVTLCIKYTTQALAIYQAQYNFKRSAECQILLGISYRRSEEFEKAEESYLLADKIANTLKNSRLKGSIHHNLGYLYSMQAKTEQAIKHYEQSYLFNEQEKMSNRLLNIFCIVSEYYKIGNYEQGLKWLDKGQKWILETNEYTEYYLHFKTYEYLMTGTNEEFEMFLKERVIPFFELRKDSKYVSSYSEELARYYESIHKYKLANNYYKISNETLKKINNI
ncbi:helix-turn-helix transcriptional regulator [Bacillus sp. BGMRC 2118]|nr:helix-turn-helix transcriptional regulator [Bacillus sp. BGMRC 2118]